MDPGRLAERLRERFPAADPLELDGADLDRALEEVGADPSDHSLVARALAEWEGMLA